jgi:2-amino-4-hydroxy-6-hydroxymethyldihydropteridine diphosphokinase
VTLPKALCNPGASWVAAYGELTYQPITGGGIMRVWVGLGGNLAGSRAAIETAVGLLADIGQVGPISSLFQSAPQERADQPDYLNAVVVMEAETEPRPLLAELKAIERRLGRDPFGQRYGPRLVDLDLLAIEGRCVDDEPDLVVPHPKLAERRFALEPLAELDPNLKPWAECPGDRRDLSVSEALAAVMDQIVEVVEGPGWAGIAEPQ